MLQQGIGIHCRVPLSSAGSDDDGRPTEFDVFISHAYEDKETFVRPLAEALIARNLRPWYDEFTLRPGDSLRRSIDHGLLTSQARCGRSQSGILRHALDELRARRTGAACRRRPQLSRRCWLRRAAHPRLARSRCRRRRSLQPFTR
jgi:TIR domain